MKHNVLISSLALIIGTVTANPVFAATPVNLRYQTHSILQEFSKPRLNGKTSKTSFKQLKVMTDFNHTQHIRMQQQYAGYTVWGADFITHTPKANSLSQTKPTKMNGVIYQNLDDDLDNPPDYIFSGQQADKAVAESIKQYKSNVENMGKITKPKAELMVYVDENNKAHWAFQTSFRVSFKNQMPQRPTFILDAINFNVYKQWNAIKSMDYAVAGGFGGNEKTGKFVYDGSKKPLHFNTFNVARNTTLNTCFLDNKNVLVVTAGTEDSPGNSYVRFNCENVDSQHQMYWSGTLDAVNGAYSPANDAMYAGELVNAMYQDWYNLLPLETQIVLRIHDPIGDNAYYEDDVTNFGDGDAVEFYPFVSLGVVAHEVSHGFTEHHSNLQYLEQSGGLNESFSDMAAKAAEYYQSGNNPDWKLGAELMKDSEALRYMDNPRRDCVDTKDKNYCSIDHISNYNPQLNVHNSSGVFNKTFYLLATSPGWNTRKAFDVMVQANVLYWTATSSFQEAACGVLEAGKDYGYDLKAINSAFAKVGIATQGC